MQILLDVVMPTIPGIVPSY
uniref:Uncharacterized protein n=1 Tax=Rhizophora mucronata TaxID=61149 RepID=A0A2P2P181_RHIMU